MRNKAVQKFHCPFLQTRTSIVAVSFIVDEVTMYYTVVREHWICHFMWRKFEFFAPERNPTTPPTTNYLILFICQERISIFLPGVKTLPRIKIWRLSPCPVTEIHYGGNCMCVWYPLLSKQFSKTSKSVYLHEVTLIKSLFFFGALSCLFSYRHDYSIIFQIFVSLYWVLDESAWIYDSYTNSILVKGLQLHPLFSHFSRSKALDFSW